MPTDRATTPFAISLDELEGASHVPAALQRTEAAEAPNEPPISRYELLTNKLLGVTGDGRW
jgi:hypothetical protein